MPWTLGFYVLEVNIEQLNEVAEWSSLSTDGHMGNKYVDPKRKNILDFAAVVELG